MWHIRNLLRLPNHPTEKLDDKLTCQPSGAETLLMVEGNSAYIRIHYQLWKKLYVTQGHQAAQCSTGPRFLITQMSSDHSLAIRAMCNSIHHVSYGFKCCGNGKPVLISDANENQRGAEKKEQSRGV